MGNKSMISLSARQQGAIGRVLVWNNGRSNLDEHTMPIDLIRLYNGILKEKRKVINIKKGIVFYTIGLSKPTNIVAWYKYQCQPIILGNIFN